MGINDEKNQWKTLSSKIVYKNEYISVQEDKIIKPNGKHGIYGFVIVPNTVGIVPLDQNNNIYLCKQYRYIFHDDSWEIPRGFVDSSEDLVHAAERELSEEAGLKAKTPTSLGNLRTSVGLLNESAEIFLARSLELDPMHSTSWEIKEVKLFSLVEVLEMIKENRIMDNLTIGSMLKTKLFLHF